MEFDDFADQMAAYDQQRYESIKKYREEEELQRKIALARERQRQLRAEIEAENGMTIEQMEQSEINKVISRIEQLADSSNNKVEDSVCCPRCGSTQLTANKKGFGLGKAAAGGLLLGPVGLLGGFFGSNKVIITCLKCGHQWKP